MALDDRIADGQSQPHPLSFGLGAEEGVENGFQVLLVDSVPGIGEIQAQSLTSGVLPGREADFQAPSNWRQVAFAITSWAEVLKRTT